MKKNETAAEANKRIMEKFKKAPKGMGEIIGKYEPVKNKTKEQEKK